MSCGDPVLPRLVRVRLVFAGTPEPALPELRRLVDSPRHEVVAVLTRPTVTAGDRLDRLALAGALLLSATLDGIADGTLTPRPQPSDGVSMAPKITVDAARVRWELPAPVVERRVRAVTPNPGAWTI